jgi:hypothetical protein
MPRPNRRACPPSARDDNGAHRSHDAPPEGETDQGRQRGGGNAVARDASSWPPRAVSEFEVLVHTGRGPCRRGTAVWREEARSSRREPPAAHGSWACALLARTCRPVSAAAPLLERLGCRRRAGVGYGRSLCRRAILCYVHCAGQNNRPVGTRRGLRHSFRRGSTLINRADPFQADAQPPVGGHTSGGRYGS